MIPVQALAGGEKAAPNEEGSPYMNRLVTPPVLIRRINVFSFKTLNRNTYSTPPPDELPLDEESLSALARGHAYKFSKHGEGVMVTCSHRIADRETAELLKGIPVKNPNTTLVAKYEDKAHCVAAFQYEWIIPDDTFAMEFQKRVETIGGSVQSNFSTPLSIEEMFSEGVYLADEVHDFFAAVPAFMANYTLRVSAVTQDVTSLRDLLVELQTARKGVQDTLKKAEKLLSIRTELGAQVKLGRLDPANEQFIELNGRLSACESLSLDVKYALTKLTEFQVSLEESLKLVHLGKPKTSQFTLEAEVARLAQLFPAFKHMRVDGETIFYQQKKFTVRFQPDGVYVEGDPVQALHKAKKSFTDDGMIGDL